MAAAAREGRAGAGGGEPAAKAEPGRWAEPAPRSEPAPGREPAPRSEPALGREPAASAEPAVRVRPLLPGDAPFLEAIFAGMSDDSRYRRFHGPKPRLSSAELRYLSEVDGWNHFAMLAFAPDGSPVGVARAVRLAENPHHAEVAVAVVDSWQRHGVGMRLVREISRLAHAGHVDVLEAVVLSDYWLSAALERRGWRVRRRPGHTVVLELAVASR